MPKIDLIFLHAPSVYDFRKEAILYGPVSDLVPSTPVFEMYPIGFTTMAEFLERAGLRTRIINLAVRMLNEPDFDAEALLAKLDPLAFGIDLHWLPHAHGSIEVAKIVKRLHPGTPVIFGGYSSSYYHTELIRYEAVDFVVRGDSTELPLLMLMQYLRTGGAARPAPLSAEYAALAKIPNLVWKDSQGETVVNPLTYTPDNLDDLLIDYSHVVKSVVRYRDLVNHIPFHNWLKYPITAALSVRGCSYNCASCGGSACAAKSLSARTRPAFRSPENLAKDVRRIGQFSRGPVFVLGDIRQGGQDYAQRFLDGIAGIKNQIFYELFDAADERFFKQISAATPNFVLEISMESHDERVRRAFGRPYTNPAIERTMDYALEAGARRVDLFFMTGLREQTYESVMETVEYSRGMLQRYSRQGETRVIPFISPMAPFLDPGSRAFENPDKYGYRLFARTLEEHRQQLLAPSWKYVLNYETVWMNRDQIVDATYEAGRRLNQMKGEFGVITSEQAAATDARIGRAVELMAEIDRIMLLPEGEERKAALAELKQQVDRANLSTVCDKRELETPVNGLVTLDLFKAAAMLFGDWWKDLTGPREREDIRRQS